ncbi:MAG: HepT-like ribonuclease domain-containing protein, partial [Acidobacteriota bacterium]
MPSKNPAQRLRDIIDNIDAIEDFTAQLDFPAFRMDRKTVYAVVRALEILSEASRRLPDELIDRHPEIDWAAIAAAGNVARHGRRRDRTQRAPAMGWRLITKAGRLVWGQPAWVARPASSSAP